jgi:hypothetical protein
MMARNRIGNSNRGRIFCDRIGPRRTLTASILCFAVGSGAMVFAPRFAAATGLSALAVFRIVRFLTGVGEAAVSSNVTRVIASWTALRERDKIEIDRDAGLPTLRPSLVSYRGAHRRAPRCRNVDRRGGERMQSSSKDVTIFCDQLQNRSSKVRKWWNWQTHHLEGVAPKGVGVQIPPSAPILRL